MSANYFNKPAPLSFSGNLSENWKKFLQKLNIFKDASGLSEKSDD